MMVLDVSHQGTEFSVALDVLRYPPVSKRFDHPPMSLLLSAQLPCLCGKTMRESPGKKCHRSLQHPPRLAVVSCQLQRKKKKRKVDLGLSLSQRRFQEEGDKGRDQRGFHDEGYFMVVEMMDG